MFLVLQLGLSLTLMLLSSGFLTFRLGLNYIIFFLGPSHFIIIWTSSQYWIFVDLYGLLILFLSGRESGKPSFVRNPPSLVLPWAVHTCQENQGQGEWGVGGGGRGVEWKREPSAISPMKQWGCSIFECVQGATEMTNTISFRAFHSHQRTKWLAKLWAYRHTKAFSWFLVLISDIFSALGDAPYHSLVKEAQLLCMVRMQKTNLPGPSHQDYFLFWKAITPLVMRAGTTLTESKTFNSEERCLQREYFYMETQRTD